MREDRQRLDKWLWFARFARTRSLAARLASDGFVRVNGSRAEHPAKAIGVGAAPMAPKNSTQSGLFGTRSFMPLRSAGDLIGALDLVIWRSGRAQRPSPRMPILPRPVESSLPRSLSS